ncbi:hypothetical protein SAMN06309944_0013 [Micrococcales bacterium KH10]|nr:hypothetical protein SAMN06309944_0013 [Micrococcales bacterium KH10]
MKRVFWVGVGVAVTVVAAKKWRELSHRQDAVGSAARLTGAAAEQVGRQLSNAGGALWDRFSGRAGDFVADFKEAATERERQLAQSLLADSQGDVEELKARRAESRDSATRPSAARRQDSEFAGDEELLGYEF